MLTVSIIAEGICSDDIFGIHTELKLPPQKNNLGLADDDNTELESVSGMFKFTCISKVPFIELKMLILYQEFDNSCNLY